jgi:hypothetical protein
MSARIYQGDSRQTYFIFVKLHIWEFNRNLSLRSSLDQYRTKTTDALYEDLLYFLISLLCEVRTNVDETDVGRNIRVTAVRDRLKSTPFAVY